MTQKTLETTAAKTTTVKKHSRGKGSRRAKAKAVEAYQMTRVDWSVVIVALIAALSTVLLSMHMNVMAFTNVTESLWAVAVGIALPLWVLALTYVAAHMQGRNWYAMTGAYALAAFALIVSMPHLVAGFTAWGLAPYEAWSLAVVTDLLQVIAKVSIITMVTGKTLNRPW